MDNFKFFSQFDLDFNRYKPMWYSCLIDVPVVLAGVGNGSVVTNNQPFLLYRITHKIKGPTYDWQTSGLMQDDSYTIEMRDEISNYQNRATSADLLFGGAREQRWLDLAIPLAYAGNRTISFRVTNDVLRTLSPETDNFQVEICLHGVADWGPLKGSVE
jgi:hypothetical protein